MSLSKASGKEPSEGQNLNRKNDSKHKNNGKSTALNADLETTPLLQESHGQDIEANPSGTFNEDQSTWSQTASLLFQRGLVWTAENLLIVVLACLLAGGTVFVCIYGGGDLA